MQPDVTKNWTVGKIAIRILDQADGESKAWFGLTNGYQLQGDGETSALELRQMADALAAAAEHIAPSPDPSNYEVTINGVGPEDACAVSEAFTDLQPARISAGWGDWSPEQLRLECLREARGDVNEARQLWSFVSRG